MRSELLLKPESKLPVPKMRAPKARPNRIFQLTKERHMTYAEVASRVRELAQSRGDEAHMKVHEISINRLAQGKTKLTQEWMTLLAEVYGVMPHEIIAGEPTQSLRRIRVVCALEGHRWREAGELPEQEQFDIMIPSEQWQDSNLYAGEIRGPDNNLRYSEQSVVILSKIKQAPGEIVEGKRYHVRRTRVDGQVEESIKMLHADETGAYWLKPESSHPAHQEWFPLAGTEMYRVELIGRVRGVFYRED
jgi:hypothetical protein